MPTVVDFVPIFLELYPYWVDWDSRAENYWIQVPIILMSWHRCYLGNIPVETGLWMIFFPPELLLVLHRCFMLKRVQSFQLTCPVEAHHWRFLWEVHLPPVIRHRVWGGYLGGNLGGRCL